ncbi:MAG: helix-turn-helix domain-containing protein [Propionibacteriaceae bacterium]|jgi:predicted transcriptional regulator|nr:helix-turn-helix domain-containing protein [Propionibacteriaceae bacterium]
MTSAQAPSIEELSRDVQRVRDSVTDAEFAKIVKRLADVGMSVRRIAALLDRPKSTVGRALKNPPLVDYSFWDDMPITVVYDIFYESGTALLGAYNHQLREASSVEEQDLWRDLIREVRAARSAVGPNDRADMVELSQHWTAERERLRHA